MNGKKVEWTRVVPGANLRYTLAGRSGEKFECCTQPF